MKHLALLFVLLAILIGCASPEKWIDDAKWYEANNYPDRAESYYARAAEKQPDNAELHYFMGRNRNRQTKLLLIERARYSSCLYSENPERTVDCDSLAAIDQRIQDCHMQAIEHFQRALELQPHMEAAFYPLANSYYETGQYDMAIYYYENILRREPDNLQAVIFLGQSYEAKGDMITARNYYQEAAGKGSQKAQELLNR